MYKTQAYKGAVSPQHQGYSGNLEGVLVTAIHNELNKPTELGGVNRTCLALHRLLMRTGGRDSTKHCSEFSLLIYPSSCWNWFESDKSLGRVGALVRSEHTSGRVRRRVLSRTLERIYIRVSSRTWGLG